MIRKLNRVIQDYLRPIRLKIGRAIFDKKIEKYSDLIMDNRLDMNRVKSIIFLRYDGKIGDMVITTLLFREIKKKYPDLKIGVLARGAAKDIIKFNPYIDKVYSYEKGKEKSIALEIRDYKYDVLVDFSETLRVNQMKLINLCRCKINIGLDKLNWKLFDISYTKKKSEHISYMYETILNLFDIESIDLNYDIYINEEIENKVKKIVSKVEKNIVILNPYAASKHRSFNIEKILEISNKILKDEKNALVFIGDESKRLEIEAVQKSLQNPRVYYPKLGGILEVAELIKYAKHVITPDTSIVHIAVSKNVPLTAVYRLDTGDNNSIVWGPKSKLAKQIFSKSVALAGEEADINDFNTGEIVL
ncbi:MAG: glycosyltransferase family 9 protein [Cetobacterium sp.]